MAVSARPSIAPIAEVTLRPAPPAPSAMPARRSVLGPFVAISMALHLLLLLFGQPLVHRWTERPGLAGSEGGEGTGSPGDGGAPSPEGAPSGSITTGASGLELIDLDLDLEPRPIPIVPFPFPPASPAPPAPERAEPAPPAEPIREAETAPEATTGTELGAGAAAGAAAATRGDGGEGSAGSGDGASGAGSGGEGAGGGAGGSPAAATAGDTPPTLVAMTLPDFPASAKKKSRVPIVLAVHVTDSGGVDDVRVERGSADCPECDAAAIASAWKMRFTPGTQGGVPVAMWVRYPVTFGRQ
jgi:TonB family protein